VLVTLAGTALLIFDMVVGNTAGLIAGGVVLVLGVLAWFVLPAFGRIRTRHDE
jgi:hypothetical protein